MRWFGRLRQSLRLLKIAHVMASHGLGALAVRLHLFRPYAWFFYLFMGSELPRETGAQLRRVFEMLGPTFIKFGQMLSTRVDLMPVDVAWELKKLQDDVPPERPAVIRTALERAYRRPLTGEDGSFASFEEEPVAAASIAQVHFATLHDGRQVAVKVRRPFVERTIEADLAILRMLASLFDRYLPEYRRLKAPEVVEEFARTIREELNLRAEAAHASRFSANLAGVEGVRVPAVVWDYTKMGVLVTERVAGTPIDERDEIRAAGHDTLKLCERLAALFFHMVFVDGYFHADLHPGNIFVSKSGDIVLVDFGIVGRMDIDSRCYLADMLLAFLKQDYRRAAEVHLEAGYIHPDVDLSAFEDAMREIAEPIFNRPLRDISLAELLLYLFSVTERFQMETRPELLLLQKTMVVIEGVARELEPEVNIWSLARPLVTAWVAEYLGPKARIERAAHQLKRGAAAWLALPDEITRLLAEPNANAFVPAEVGASDMLLRLIGLALVVAGSAALAIGWRHALGWPDVAGTAMLAAGSVLALRLRR